jgi:antitoxin component of MazEF toxin-antitoxin module
VTKVRNIEKAGGSLAVIIDNTNYDIHDIVMSDDGTGAGIRIPSMLISEKDGKVL